MIWWRSAEVKAFLKVQPSFLPLEATSIFFKDGFPIRLVYRAKMRETQCGAFLPIDWVGRWWSEHRHGATFPGDGDALSTLDFTQQSGAVAAELADGGSDHGLVLHE
jgi:hypothetical protein